MPSNRKCLICSSRSALTERPANYRYEHIGLSNVFLVGKEVAITSCQKCGHVTTGINNELQLLDVLGLNIVLSAPGLKGEELRYLRTMFDLTQADLAKAMGLPRRETIAEWEAKDRIFAAPSAEVAPRLVLLGLFKTHVFESEFCQLTTNHRRLYDEFTHSIVDRIDDLLQTTETRPHYSARRVSKNREWLAEPVPG
jgi:transcriptional regulator with XRE-family HTH domain